MKKALTLLCGLMIAAIAVWAVPRDINKDVPGIEKSIQMKVEVIKNQVIHVVTIANHGDSPGRAVQPYSFIILEQPAEENSTNKQQYSFSWRSRNFIESTNKLTKIKLTQHRIPRQIGFRC